MQQTHGPKRGGLAQEQVAAFAAVARHGTFTRAAAALRVPQPTLSRQIQALEKHVRAVLLVRGRTGVTLTEAGRRVLEYVDTRRALEEELLGSLAPAEAGIVRIAGLSSLVPSVVLHALAPFLRTHPEAQIAIHRDVDRRYVENLAAGRVDFAIADEPANSPGILEKRVGEEMFAMVESSLYQTRRDVFLDVSARDNTTTWFLERQPPDLLPKGPPARSFMFDEHGILLAVELGLGRAVKPIHSVPTTAKVRIDSRFIAAKKPVYLLSRKQRHHGPLHRAVRECLVTALRARLAKPNEA